MAFDKPTFDNQDDVDFKLHIATLESQQLGKSRSRLSEQGRSVWQIGINKVLRYQHSRSIMLVYVCDGLGGSVCCRTGNDGKCAMKCEVCRDDTTEDLFIRLTRVIICSDILPLSPGFMVASGRTTVRVIPQTSCRRPISSITQALRNILGYNCCLGVSVNIIRPLEVAVLIIYRCCSRKLRF
jgi:hypothetical protein